MGMMFDKKKDKMTEEEESKNLLDANGTLHGAVKSSGGYGDYIKVGIMIIAAAVIIYKLIKKRSRK